MRISIIDLGTNTFNLSVSEINGDEFIPITNDKDGVGLGLGGINENKIADDAMQRGIAALEKFKKISIDHGATKFILIGTSALRNAQNRDEFLQRVNEKLRFKIHVISGEEEARLIYDGVTFFQKPEKPVLVMDIGGGSTEFIFADSSGMQKFKSFEIGVSRIYQMFELHDPLTESDVSQIEKYLEKSCGNFFDDMYVDELIGASGTFETFYELCYNDRYPARKSVSMDKLEFVPHLAYVIGSTRAERERNEWIIPIRKKMAPIAAVKIQWILRKLDIKSIAISPFSLKEGVLKNLDKYVD